MNNKKLFKLLEGLKENGLGLIVKEFNENIIFTGVFKSYRLGTSLVEVVDLNDKKKLRKKSKQLAKEVIALTKADCEDNLDALKKRFRKEKKDLDKFTDSLEEG